MECSGGAGGWVNPTNQGRRVGLGGIRAVDWGEVLVGLEAGDERKEEEDKKEDNGTHPSWMILGHWRDG